MNAIEVSVSELLARRTRSTDDGLSNDWVRPPSRPGDLRFDVILAAVLLVSTAVSALLYGSAGIYPKPAPIWLTALYAVVACAPLALRRRFPEAVAFLVTIAFVGAQLLLVPELLFSNITLFIALYSVGAWVPNRKRAAIVRTIIIVGMFAWLFATVVARSPGPTGSSASGPLSSFLAIGFIQLFTNLLYFGAAYYSGDRAWAAARARAALERRTVELERERELNSRRAVTLERLRIARDLHDVVAHHVSLMGVQAGAARRVIDTDRVQAVTSLRSIEVNARNAVTELQRMLTTLRDDESDPGAARSLSDGPTTRGIDQLESLVVEARQAGLAASLQVVGPAHPIAGTIGVIIYRIAQESVTNSLKYAEEGARLDVRLRYLARAIEIEVSDSGGGVRQGNSAHPGSGLGHIGMRERVDAVGGTIHIGPTSRGGFVVRATIPTEGDGTGSTGGESFGTESAPHVPESVGAEPKRATR